MSPDNADQLCSTQDTPIDPVTREPVQIADVVPAPAPEARKKTRPASRSWLRRRIRLPPDDAEAQRAVIVKSTRRQIPCLEIYFTGTKAMGLDIAVALSKPKSVVARVGPVAWDI